MDSKIPIGVALALAALLLSPPAYLPATPATTGAGVPVSAFTTPAPEARSRPFAADGFLENAGQVSDARVRLYSTGGGMRAAFERQGIVLDLPAPPGSGLGGAVVRARFEGANPVDPQGRDALPRRSNFFLGNDPERWRNDVPAYREVVYPSLYEGTNLIYRLAGGRLKYEFVLDPGADPGAIRLAYEGIDTLAVDPDGALVALTRVGELRDTAPVSWQGFDPVVCRFVLVGPASVTFDCPDRDPARPLVIDPLVWATYLGGSAYDDARGVAVDGAGNVYVTGQVRSTDFPTTPGAYNRTFGGAQFDAFVAKYDPTGSTLLYATYLGGTGNEIGLALAVDASGDAFVGGQTASANFPTTAGALDRVLNGSNDAFLAKLDPAGGTLLYSTFLGGVTGEAITALLVDASGDAYVAGVTGSPDFPTTAGAFSRTFGGSFLDVFVAAFDPAGGSLLFSTFLGGSDIDDANGLARDASGNLYVAGRTSSTNFPATAGAYSNVMNGTSDAFVAKFSPTGSALLYATFLGGTGGPFDGEGANAIAVDASGDAYVAGTTTNLDFPTTPGAFNRTYGGATDGFVAKLNPTGSALVFSTYLGGVKEDDIFGIAVDGGGRAIVAGYTNSSAFPTTAGADNATFLGGPYDAFLTKLDGTGGALAYSTFLGGGGNDLIYGFTLDASGSAYVVGTTNSTNFPVTAGAANTTYAGAYDAFVAKLELGFPVVLATSPSGLQVEFDGNRVVAPHSFLCDLGSSHTVFAPSPQVQSSRRYVFNAWSDAGAQTHAIACTGPRTLTANFVATEYEMTIASAPPGLLVSVDGPQVTAPFPLWCVIGSSHTLDVPSPQSGGSTRYVFASWSDGGAQFHGITCDAPRTITASFDIEYQISVTATPLACQILVDGIPWLPPVTFWWGSGTTHGLDVPSPQVFGTTRYVFGSWSDGGAKSHSVVATGPDTYTATCLTQYQVTVDTVPLNLQVLVNGTVHTAPHVFWCDMGANAALDVPTPQVFGNTRYAFASWSDGQPRAHVVACPSPASYTATFGAEYALTIATAPSALQVVLDGTTRVAPYTFYCPDGSNHTVAVPSPQGSGAVRETFLTWSDGLPQVHAITCYQPATVTALFVTEDLVTVDTTPPNLEITVDGVLTTAPQTYWWRQGTPHAVDVPSPQVFGNTRYAFASWSDGGAQAHAVTVSGPATLTTAFRTEFAVFLTTSPLPLAVRVDGTPYATPRTLWLPAGSTSTFTVDSPQSGTPGVRYAWIAWSDGGALSHPILITSPFALTASFQTAYQLLVQSQRGTPWCDLPDCWYAANATATFGIATPIDAGTTRYVLRLWTGNLTSTRSINAIAMDGPKTEVAQWKTQHFLYVVTTPGTGTGEGWYDEGTVANFQVNGTEATGPDGMRYRFVGWTLDFNGSSPQGSIRMDRPRTVLAVWRPLPFLESNAWSLTLLGIAAVLLVLLWVFWRRRKREDKAERGDTSGPEEEPAATVETRGEPAPERKDDVDADFDELEL